MGSQQLQAGFSAALATFPSMHPGYSTSAPSSAAYFLGSNAGATDPTSAYTSLANQAVATSVANSWPSCSEANRQSASMAGMSAAECAADFSAALASTFPTMRPNYSTSAHSSYFGLGSTPNASDPTSAYSSLGE